MHKTTGKKIPKIILKSLLWLVLGILGLVILAVIVIQFPGPQNYLTDKISKTISKKINSKVALGRINIAFPKDVSLTDLYIEDLHQDTLLYVHSLKINLNLFDLFSKKLELKDIYVEKLTAHVYREFPDTTFNYSFIPEAFAGKKEKPAQKDSTENGFEFSIDHVELADIYVTYHDTLSGTIADVKLGSFETDFDQFDLNTKKIHIDDVALKRTAVSLVQYPPLKKDTTASQPFTYDLNLKSIQLSQVKTTYINKDDYQDLRADIGNLTISSEKLDIKNERIDLKKIQLSESAIAYRLNKHITADTVKKAIEQKEPSTDQKKSNWVITLDALQLQGNSMAYDNDNKVAGAQGFDANHILLRNLSTDMEDIHIAPDNIELVVNEMSLREQKGFVLRQFSSRLTYDQNHIELADLKIETDKSRIGNYIGIAFRSINTIADSLGSLKTKVNLQNTVIALSDVLQFKPDLLNNPRIHLDKNTAIALNCKIDGTVDDLQLNQLKISSLNNTSVELNGILKKVRDPKQLFANITLTKLQTGKQDIEQVMDTSVLSKTIAVPNDILITGSFKGYLKNFDGAANVSTSIGNASASIKMNPAAGNKEQAYEAHAHVDRFDLGKLLRKQDLLGPLSIKTDIKGEGLTDSTIHAELKTVVREAVFKKYAYRNLSIEGIIHKKSFEGKANIDDKNLAFDYWGIVDLDSLHPRYNFVFNLSGADLKALNLSDEDLRVSTLLQSDLKKEGTENITGTATVKNVVIIKKEQKFTLDSLVFRSAYKDNSSVLTLTSEILNARASGDIHLSELPNTLKKQFDHYFNLQQKDTIRKTRSQKFDFEMNVTDPTLLTEGIVPNLEKLTPFSIKGMYSSEANNIKLEMTLPQVVYSQIAIDTFNLKINSDAKQLRCGLYIAEVSNPTIKVENINLGSQLFDNTLHFQLRTAKDDSTKMLSIAGSLKSELEHFLLTFEPLLVLNNSNWNIHPDNSLQFGKNGLIAHQLTLSQNQQSVVINSQTNSEQAPLEIKLKSFELQTLSKLIENKKELVKGTLSGNVVLKKENQAPAFTSDISIKNLVFNEIPTGDVQLIADNTGHPKKYNVKLGLSGNGNDVHLNGFYNAESSQPLLNFFLDIRHLNLTSAEAYTFGQVTQMSGDVNGKIQITGSTSAPDLRGNIHMHSCAFRPRIIDSYLKVEDETITLESRKVRFDSFTLVDSLDNKAVLDGYADIQNMKSIPFDIHLKANDFLALNTTEADNPLYFGTLYLDSDLQLKGTSDHPVITGKLGLDKGTIITYVKPETSFGKNESKGIVEFIDTVETQKHIMTRKKKEAEVSSTKGVNVNAIIQFDKDAELKMLVDRVAGDSLYIKGSGQLEFSMDEGGKMNLIGKYRINDGGYHLTINEFIKKNFTIAKGSSVTWSGDVTDPYVDIKAIYKVKASPVDLVQNELSGADQLERNKYRTLMTFLVYLKMNGFVSTPEISFDIQQPSDERGALNGAVNAKLSELRGDESQLNKQVFALLALNRFIGEDPLESGGAGGISSTSRASASRILTQQLSNLSEKYVRGVDLNLGVNSYEDYSSGQQEGRTQLQLGVSKTLLNDRVTVQVGGNVDVEGEKAKQNNASNVAGNISIEYKLTDDGRYKLKGFRENEYDNPIEGELTKTGFGIMYRRNYNKLRELFSKPQPKKKTTE